jgi:hypothetical protein
MTTEEDYYEPRYSKADVVGAIERSIVPGNFHESLTPTLLYHLRLHPSYAPLDPSQPALKITASKEDQAAFLAGAR